MRHGDVVNLAWDLADAVAPTLTKLTRTTLFATLGAGHAEDTIEALLRECGVAHQCLTPELASRVRIWVEHYVCPVDRPTLRHLVDSITAPPVMPRPKTPMRLVASKRDRPRVPSADRAHSHQVSSHPEAGEWSRLGPTRG